MLGIDFEYAVHLAERATRETLIRKAASAPRGYGGAYFVPTRARPLQTVNIA